MLSPAWYGMVGDKEMDIYCILLCPALQTPLCPQKGPGGSRWGAACLGKAERG